MKMGYVLAGILLAAIGGQVLAEPSTQVAWTPETLKFVRNGDPEKGKAIAESCDACHAATPENAESEFPYLQGQTATYLYKQLHDYRSGSRSNEIMVGISAGLSDQDMADVSAWYSRQPRPRKEGRRGSGQDPKARRSRRRSAHHPALLGLSRPGRRKPSPRHAGSCRSKSRVSRTDHAGL